MPGPAMRAASTSPVSTRTRRRVESTRRSRGPGRRPPASPSGTLKKRSSSVSGRTRPACTRWRTGWSVGELGHEPPSPPPGRPSRRRRRLEPGASSPQHVKALNRPATASRSSRSARLSWSHGPCSLRCTIERGHVADLRAGQPEPPPVVDALAAGVEVLAEAPDALVRDAAHHERRGVGEEAVALAVAPVGRLVLAAGWHHATVHRQGGAGEERPLAVPVEHLRGHAPDGDVAAKRLRRRRQPAGVGYGIGRHDRQELAACRGGQPVQPGRTAQARRQRDDADTLDRLQLDVGPDQHLHVAGRPRAAPPHRPVHDGCRPARRGRARERRREGGRRACQDAPGGQGGAGGRL